jgi:multimeric flavodoxin WrbA
MKRVTAFIGSARKKGTYLAIQEFEKNLKQYGDIDFEYVFLNDYHLEFCNGCKLCFDKGEQFCPYTDDRNVLIEKMVQSDGVIFASPSYAFQVSGRMKNLALVQKFHKILKICKTTDLYLYHLFSGSAKNAVDQSNFFSHI